MHLNLLKTAGLLATLFAIVSCQKENGEAPFTSNDSTLLKEVVQRDITQPSGLDSLSKIVYSYDQQDRVVQSITYSYALNPTPQNISRFELQYHGNDTLPYLFIQKFWTDPTGFPGSTPIFTDSLYLFYNGDRIVKDSFLFHNSPATSVVTTYTEVQPTQVNIRIQEKWKGGAIYNDRGVFKLYLAKVGNNITNMKDTVGFFGGPTPRQLVSTFDNKINPYRNISLHYPFNKMGLMDGYIPDIVPAWFANRNDNNITTLMDVHPALSFTYNFSFEYFDNGRPSKQFPAGTTQHAFYKYGPR